MASLHQERKVFKSGARFFGTLGEDLVFRKSVRFSKHLYRELDSWGIDRRIVQELVADNCVSIEITDLEDRVKYTVPLATFVKKAQQTNHLDWGCQLHLPRHLWQVELLPKQLAFTGVG